MFRPVCINLKQHFDRTSVPEQNEIVFGFRLPTEALASEGKADYGGSPLRKPSVPRTVKPAGCILVLAALGAVARSNSWNLISSSHPGRRWPQFDLASLGPTGLPWTLRGTCFYLAWGRHPFRKAFQVSRNRWSAPVGGCALHLAGRRPDRF